MRRQNAHLRLTPLPRRFKLTQDELLHPRLQPREISKSIKAWKRLFYSIISENGTFDIQALNNQVEQVLFISTQGHQPFTHYEVNNLCKIIYSIKDEYKARGNELDDEYRVAVMRAMGMVAKEDDKMVDLCDKCELGKGRCTFSRRVVY